MRSAGRAASPYGPDRPRSPSDPEESEKGPPPALGIDVRSLGPGLRGPPLAGAGDCLPGGYSVIGRGNRRRGRLRLVGALIEGSSARSPPMRPAADPEGPWQKPTVDISSLAAGRPAAGHVIERDDGACRWSSSRFRGHRNGAGHGSRNRGDRGSPWPMRWPRGGRRALPRHRRRRQPVDRHPAGESTAAGWTSLLLACRRRLRDGCAGPPRAYLVWLRHPDGGVPLPTGRRRRGAGGADGPAIVRPPLRALFLQGLPGLLDQPEEPGVLCRLLPIQFPRTQAAPPAPQLMGA